MIVYTAPALKPRQEVHFCLARDVRARASHLHFPAFIDKYVKLKCRSTRAQYDTLSKLVDKYDLPS